MVKIQNCKKVVFLTLDISLIGGVEKMISTLSNHFISMNEYEIEIISFFKSNKKTGFNFNEEKIIFLSKEKFDLSSIGNKIKSYFKIFISIVKFKKEKNTIYLSTFPNISLLFLIIQGNKNFIITEHSQFNAHNKFLNTIRRLLYKKAKKIIVLTKSQYNVFSKFIKKDNLHLIPNPIDKKNILSSNLNSSVFRILTAGRLEYNKGYDILLKIIFELSKQHKNINLIILGDGIEKINLLNEIDKLKLNSYVKIISGESDIFKFLKDSDVFVSTSRSESFGIAILEALSVGVPVISFDAGDGPKSLISHGKNGFIIPFNDVKLYVEKLSKMLNLNNDEYKTFQVNSIKSSERFFVESLYGEWQDIIQSFECK